MCLQTNPIFIEVDLSQAIGSLGNIGHVRALKFEVQIDIPIATGPLWRQLADLRPVRKDTPFAAASFVRHSMLSQVVFNFSTAGTGFEGGTIRHQHGEEFPVIPLLSYERDNIDDCKHDHHQKCNPQPLPHATPTPHGIQQTVCRF